MPVRYDSELVMMSVFVAMLASYAALDLAGRITASRGRAAWLWTGGGALAMGAGIWSMHFIGMLAIRMPITLAYAPGLTAVSFLVAVVTSGFALLLASRPVLAPRSLVVGALVMGAGMCGMHYTGMAAMHMSPAIRYDPRLFAASIAIAVLASLVALYLTFRLRSRARNSGYARRICAAVAMGLAISGMHYTGMAAARFAPGSVCLAAVPGDGNLVGHALGLMMLLFLGLTLLASISDEHVAHRTALLLRTVRSANDRLRRATSQLRESEAKYRALLDTTSDSVVLVDERGLVTYANPTLHKMFGYMPEEVVGTPLARLQPERLRLVHEQAFRHFLDTGLRTIDWSGFESIGLHRDGREIPIEVAFSEVRLDGTRLFAGYIRDCSERKEREARIARLSRVHAVLSGINSLIVRAKTRQELFDGACRIAVEQGRFRMAAVIVLKDGLATPAARHGLEEGYADRYLQIRIDDSGPMGRGPTACAIREGQVKVCNDIAADPDMQHWHTAAAQRGYASSAAFPLKVDGRIEGCFNLYAAERKFFNDDELKLLKQLADDISHAMESIARGERLDYLVYYDALTGLANRNLFCERVGQATEAVKAEGRGLGLVTLDIAHFKAVNDSVGPGIADQLLKQVADRLVTFCGAPLRVGRVGPDRFALLVDAQDWEELIRILDQRLWPVLDQPFRAGHEDINLSFKGGISRFPPDGSDSYLLFRESEAALKVAKVDNVRYLLFRPDMSSAMERQLQLERKLRQASERGEFELFYQPKVSIRTGEICGAEALLRWRSPDGGIVSPELFVPVLEETGMIVEVGRWVLTRAVADLRRWREQGLAPPPVAVNVSPAQLRHVDFVPMVASALGQTDGQRTGVDLEITETLLLADAQETIRKLTAVRAMGAEIAIDDFGIGYSSLAYLARLPISAIKIDRSFVSDMNRNPISSMIVEAVISLARNLHLRAIAEGVEAPEQLRALRQLGCEEMQGFLFSPAVPAAEFALMIGEGRRLALGDDRRTKVAPPS